MNESIASEATRDKQNSSSVLKTVALAGLTVLALYLCWRLTAPFLNAIVWGLTLAVAAAPLRKLLFARLPRLAATCVIVALIVIIIALPLSFVLRQLLQEAAKAQTSLRSSMALRDWSFDLAAHPWLGQLWIWTDQQLDLSEIGQKIAGSIALWVAPAAARSIGVISQTGATLFVLFFLLRDEELILTAIRRVVPLSASETDNLFERISSAVQSAVYGRLFVGLLQGFLGGVIFALVGLPAPVFWGAVMSILSTLPVVGAFVVWAPASVVLLLGGHWLRALIVLIWGVGVIHPIDNVLYPVLIGARMGLHPLLLFVAFLGGVIAFGATGLILGPCIIAAAVALAEIWRERSLAPAGR